MGSVVGIYFGIKAISIVESKNKKSVNNIQIPYEKVIEGELEEKVPEEIKLVGMLKSTLRTAGIEAKDAVITLPGNDLIIRSFEISFLPKEELLTAINFEARKYIPFKTEDLISDFQLRPDRGLKKNLVLFFSMKKEILDKYISVVEQLGLNIINIEYSAFSLLRLLDLRGVKKRETFGFIDIDLEEETNFIVLDKCFPLFSRDINLALGLEAEALVSKTPKSSLFWERLKNEIRISLDYYRRKFPSKSMDKIVILANQMYKNDIDIWSNELGLPVEFIDTSNYIADQQMSFGLSSIKAYSASLAYAIKTLLKINLLSVREKMKELKTSEAESEIALPMPPIRLDYRFILFGLFIIFLSFALGSYKRLPLAKEIKSILDNRIKLVSLASDKSYEELQTIYSEYKNKVDALDIIINNKIYLTEELNIIPSVLPEGTWLVELSFSQNTEEAKLTLSGCAFLNDRNKEIGAVNNIPYNLKTNPVFSRIFKDIVSSLNQTKVQDQGVTNFIISCRTKKHGT